MKNIRDDKSENRRPLTEEEINSPEFNPEEFAPAPTELVVEEKKNSSRTVMIVAIMCALFALVIAVVGVLLANGTEKGREELCSDMIVRCYDSCDSASFYNNVDGCDVYGVYFGERLAGYAVFCKTEGYGGEIETLICFDADNKICRVKVVSENEPDGLGDKVTKAEFLKQFKGLSADKADNLGVDLVARATVSSNAVTEAVTTALKLNVSTFSIAKDLGVATITSEELEEVEKQTEASTTEKKPSQNKETKPVKDTEKPKDSGLGGIDTGDNVNNGGGDIKVDTTHVTTVYETETKAEDTTVSEETTVETTAETTAEPVETTAPPVETTAAPETTEAPVETTAPTEETTVAPETTAAPVETTAPEESAASDNSIME